MNLPPDVFTPSFWIASFISSLAVGVRRRVLRPISNGCGFRFLTPFFFFFRLASRQLLFYFDADYLIAPLSTVGEPDTCVSSLSGRAPTDFHAMRGTGIPYDIVSRCIPSFLCVRLLGNSSAICSFSRWAKEGVPSQVQGLVLTSLLPAALLRLAGKLLK